MSAKIKRAILFRFHKDVAVCTNRLKMMRLLNPDIPIYGLFGGPEHDLPKWSKALQQYIEHIYILTGKSKDWNWLHYDLGMREWYRDIGQHVVFDMLYIIEWDLLICQTIEKAYAGIGLNEAGFTGLIRLCEIEKKWFWPKQKEWHQEWVELLAFVKNKFNYNQAPFASLGPGTCLPKVFFENYLNTDVPKLCHDEVRLPLFAQSFNIKCVDTGFYKNWFDKKEELIFNCDNAAINMELIRNELRTNGRKIFHPVRLEFNEIYEI